MLLFSCVGLAYVAVVAPDLTEALSPFFAPLVFFSLAGLVAGLLAVALPNPGVIRTILALVAGLLVMWGMESLVSPFDVFYLALGPGSLPAFLMVVLRYLITGAVTGWCVALLARAHAYAHALALGLPMAALLGFGMDYAGFAVGPLAAVYALAYAAPFPLGAWLAVDYDPRGALFRPRAR